MPYSKATPDNCEHTRTHNHQCCSGCSQPAGRTCISLSLREVPSSSSSACRTNCSLPYKHGSLQCCYAEGGGSVMQCVPMTQESANLAEVHLAEVLRKLPHHMTKVDRRHEWPTQLHSHCHDGESPVMCTYSVTRKWPLLSTLRGS